MEKSKTAATETIQSSIEITYEAFKMSFQAFDSFVQCESNAMCLLVKDDFEIDHLLLLNCRTFSTFAIFGRLSYSRKKQKTFNNLSLHTKTNLPYNRTEAAKMYACIVCVHV